MAIHRLILQVCICVAVPLALKEDNTYCLQAELVGPKSDGSM